MASTYTTRVGLEKQGDGENANTWGLVLNENVIDLVDEAVAGYEAISLAGGGLTLTNTDGVTNQARNFGLKFTGALPADTTVVVPAKEKIYYVHNSTTENYNVFLKPAGGTAVTVVEAGRSMIAAVDGTNINLLESTDPAIFATKVEVQALSATLATSINNSNTAIATLSVTMATSINNSNTAIALVSSTLESRIATVSSTMATSVNNLKTGITGGTIVAATAINATNAVNATSATNATNFAGNNSAYYTNAGNLNAGTLLAARLSGDYSINNTGTLDGFNASDFLRVTSESLSNDGYIEFSNGLIIQWGRENLSAVAGESILWPKAFVSTPFISFGVEIGSPDATANITGGTRSASGWTNINTAGSGLFHWIAIGV
jgi:hypothetical protein